MARGRHSILRQAVLGFVLQHPAGVRFDIIVHQFQHVGRTHLAELLYNLRQAGEIHCIQQPGERGNALWKPGRDPRALVPLTGADVKRLQRAREADARHPLVYFGDGLQPPRCPSVWAYARYFQEARA